MKKIYSLVLLATTLLFSTNAMAQNVCTLDGVEKSTLLEAINAANASAEADHTIVLIADVSISDPALGTNTLAQNYSLNRAQQLVISGKNITLDLNGHSINAGLGFSLGDPYKTTKGADRTLTGNADDYRTALFILYKGRFDIIGSGTINNGIKQSGIAVAIAGSDNAEATNFSVLNVGKDATLLGGNDGMGIYIDHYHETSYKATECRCIPHPQSLPDGISAAVRNKAYGVVANVAGRVYGGQYGIQISGNVDKRPTDSELEAIKSATPEEQAAFFAPYPTVNLLAGSLVYAEPNLEAATGIYAAGYGNWNLAGTVQGSTGAYMKSGNVDIVQGAVIESTNTANYTETETGKKSGIKAGGSAVVIEATKFYAGGNSLDIKGGDIIAASGYAIDENRDVSTPVGNNGNNITITAGNFKGGDEGLLKTTDEVKEKIKEEGTITGGVFDAQEIQEYLPNINGYIQYADGGDNKYQVVPIPATEEIQNDPATAADDSYVKMEGTTSFTVANGETRTFAALMLTSDDNVVRVKDGGKLVVSNAATILGNAKIIVEAGGQFIIEGAQGLIADNVNQLTIEAQEGKMGLFMINPDVSANTTPAATVELVTKAYKNGSNYVWQRIGVPAVNGITASSIVKSVASYLQYWDDQQGKYVGISGPSHLLLPFQGLSLTNDATAPGQKYKFPCNLVGNTNGGLNLVGRWTSFANSYTANIDLQALLHDMKNAANVSAAAYVYRMADDDWDEISYADLVDGIANQTVLEPMQAFIFNLVGENITNAATEINYRNSIWDPVFAPTPAPARRGNNSNVTRAIITITDINGNTDKVALRQGVDFSADFDNGYDMTKNMSLSDTRIYANTQLGEMAQVATNDLIGLNLSVASKNETMFKMTFSHINGEELAIRDNLTGSVIDITEGAEYFFSVAENSVNNRFEIIAAHKAPTALDEVGAAHGAKGVYTVLGQYIGSTADINALPAGIYVVDGVKIVK